MSNNKVALIPRGEVRRNPRTLLTKKCVTVKLVLSTEDADGKADSYYAIAREVGLPVISAVEVALWLMEPKT